MKKNLLIIMMLFILVGCTNTKEKMTTTDAIKFKKEYECLNGEKTDYDNNTYRVLDIDKDNPIIYKNANDIIDMLDSGETFVVYFGFANCPWCRSIISTLIEAANDLEIETIYYVNIIDIRDNLELDNDGNIVTSKEATSDYYKLLDKFESVLNDYTLTDKEGNVVSTNEKRIYAPNIVSVIDGVPTKMTTGISDLQENAYMELTEDIKADSYDKIKCTIECIVKEKAVCSVDKKC